MRKKLSTCLIALAAMLTFSPQAWGEDVDYSTQCLRITALNNSTLYFTTPSSDVMSNVKLEYKTPESNTWNTLFSETKTASSVTLGSKCGQLASLYMGANTTYEFRSSNWGTNFTNTHYIRIHANYSSSSSSPYKFIISGNVMSLVNNGNFDETNDNTIPRDYCFKGLFSAESSASANYVFLDASNLILPAMNLTKGCYAKMFSNNDNFGIGGTPELPAEILAESCYEYMFSDMLYFGNAASYSYKDGNKTNTGSTAYTSTELANILNNRIFGHAKVLASYCYFHMFDNSSSVFKKISTDKTVILPCKTLAEGCYSYMFYGNFTNEMKIEIKATSLYDCEGNEIKNALSYMFGGSSSITTNSCYFTVHFPYWTATPSNTSSPTYNWLYNRTRPQVYGPETLTKSSNAHTIPSSGSKSTLSTKYLVFDVNTNGGQWESGCVADSVVSVAKISTPIKTGYVFDGWYTEASGGTEWNNALQSTTTKYYAQFSVAPGFTLTIKNCENGKVEVVNAATSTTVSSGSYDANTHFTYTAIPDPGYKLKAWTDDALTLNGDFLLSKNTTLGATFEEKSYTLKIANTENGTISTDNVSYKQDNTAQPITLGTTVTFTANPAPHYDFTSWTYDLEDQTTSQPFTGKLTITGMTDENVVVGATFTIQKHTITANGEGGYVTLKASGYADAEGSGTYDYNTSVQLKVIPNDGKRFVQWSDGDTENPRTITITSDTTFTAEFGIESADASVTPSQDATHDVTQIVYYLKPATYDNITYTPVDMGYGVAWADRNMGAAAKSDIGGYYYWGGLEPHTSFECTTYQSYNCKTLTALHDTADVAYVKLGYRWHIPTKDEWLALKNNTTFSNYTYTSKSDNSASITLPATGAYMPDKSGSSSTGGDYLLDDAAHYYWTKTLGQKGSDNWLTDKPYYYKDNAVQYGSTTYGGDKTFSGNAPSGMPVRAIYTPPFEPIKLTINVGGYKYEYLCQEGQKVTVTPTPATGYMFDKWQDNKSTTAARTFTIGNKNAEYTATFKVIPQTFTVTIANGNSEYGSVDQTSLTDVVDGTAISVNGNTLTINGTTVTATANEANALYTYAFTGWTGTAATVTDNMTITANFTATQKEYFELVDTARVGDNFYTILDTLAGKEKNVKYMRTFEAGSEDTPSWNVFSLPFAYNIEEDQNFQGRVVQLDHATYYEGTLTLYFVYQNTYLNANKPYVFYNTGDALENPVFNEVTIVEPEVKTDYAVDCAPQGQVYFKNTIVRGPLPSSQEHDIAFIYNNELGYSKGNNSMRAFRGYFEMDGVRPSGSSAPRRIVMMVDEATALVCDMDVETNTTKKVIEDGILYIERNGVRYNAQGATIR